MKMNKKHRAVFLSVMLAAALFPVRPVEAQQADLAAFVNPFVGTGNSPLPDYLGGNASGNTFPGATLPFGMVQFSPDTEKGFGRSEEHTSELQSRQYLVCRLLLEKKKTY